MTPLTPAQLKEWIDILAQALDQSTFMLSAFRTEHAAVMHGGDENAEGCPMTSLLNHQLAINSCLLERLCGRDAVPPVAEQH